MRNRLELDEAIGIFAVASFIILATVWLIHSLTMWLIAHPTIAFIGVCVGLCAAIWSMATRPPQKGGHQ